MEKLSMYLFSFIFTISVKISSLSEFQTLLMATKILEIADLG